MGLLDLFRKKDPDDGTYRRDRSGDSGTDGGAYSGYDTYGGGADGGFRFTVEDVFTIAGRGTVVTGRVESGTVSVGETVTLRGRQMAVMGIEMFRRTLDTAKQGDNAGLLLRDVSRNDVVRGDILEKL